MKPLVKEHFFNVRVNAFNIFCHSFDPCQSYMRWAGEPQLIGDLNAGGGLEKQISFQGEDGCCSFACYRW